MARVDLRPITCAQIRGARGMLDWSMVDLVRAAGVSVSTVKRAEDETEAVSCAKLGLIRGALEAAGVRFMPDHGEGEGIALKAR